MMSFLFLLSFCGGDWEKLGLGEEEIEIYRDEWGIPHVFAPSRNAAFFAQGYCAAQDRLWQMETFRRAARGELAEIFGKAKLNVDRDRRRRGYTEVELRDMMNSCEPRFREATAFYTKGVNAWIGTAKKSEKLPKGYGEREISPRPWTETDSLAIGIMMARRFGEAGDLELKVLKTFTVIESLKGKEMADHLLHDLYRDHDPMAPTTLNDHLRVPAKRKEGSAEHGTLPRVGLETLVRHERECDEIRAELEPLGIPVYTGSNAWVVGPKKSASGKAMLYGGPMMGFGTPSICHEVHLKAPGLEAMGMSFAGSPGVLIGWNGFCAWTTTSGGADLVDVYILDVHPEDPERYRHKGEWKKFDVREETIKVKDEPDHKMKVQRSIYGPVIEFDLDHHIAYASKASFWMQEQKTYEGVIGFNFVRSLEEFRQSVRKIVTSHSFFTATVDGTIGFWYCGAHPVRQKGHDPKWPQKGDGSMDWEGILPFEKWPQAVDPPHGFFANWNNKPSRDWEPAPFGQIFWGKKIIDVLESKEKVTFDEVMALARQTAYHDFVADYFIPLIVEACAQSRDEEVRKVVAYLERYDRMKREGEIGPVLLEKWADKIMAAVFGEVVGPIAADRKAQRYLADVLLYTLQGEKTGISLQHNYLGKQDRKEVIVAALKKAIAELKQSEGDWMKQGWKESTVNFDVLGRVRSERGRGTYQMAVELGTPPKARTCSAPGQSENPDDPHYRDQMSFFEKWEFKPVKFARDEMK